MTTIIPTYNQNKVTHKELEKFGVDNPQNSATFKKSIIEQNSIILTTINYLPQIISSSTTRKVINVKRKINKKYYNTVEVDRKTGFIIKQTEGFADIFRFDPSTLSNKKNQNIKNIGYWNKLNKYIGPKVIAKN